MPINLSKRCQAIAMMIISTITVCCSTIVFANSTVPLISTGETIERTAELGLLSSESEFNQIVFQSPMSPMFHLNNDQLVLKSATQQNEALKREITDLKRQLETLQTVINLSNHAFETLKSTESQIQTLSNQAPFSLEQRFMMMNWRDILLLVIALIVLTIPIMMLVLLRRQNQRTTQLTPIEKVSVAADRIDNLANLQPKIDFNRLEQSPPPALSTGFAQTETIDETIRQVENLLTIQKYTEAEAILFEDLQQFPDNTALHIAILKLYCHANNPTAFLFHIEQIDKLLSDNESFRDQVFKLYQKTWPQDSKLAQKLQRYSDVTTQPSTYDDSGFMSAETGDYSSEPADSKQFIGEAIQLAKEHILSKDFTTAKSILDKILQQGNSEEQSEAQKLLQQMQRNQDILNKLGSKATNLNLR